MEDDTDVVLETAGDVWYNVNKFHNQLDSLVHKPRITISVRAEGPCLKTLGVVDALDHWLQQNNRLPESIVIKNWNNFDQSLPYTVIRPNPRISHFVPMSLDYWPQDPQAVVEVGNYVKLIGLFVGRLSVSRSIILYETAVKFGKFTTFSKMKSSKALWPWDIDHEQNRCAERFDQWLPMFELQRMIRWYIQHSLPSIDDVDIKDQFGTPTAYVHTNRSLLNHYANFAVELVCETFVYGETFSPTEKTLRPLTALKPMLIHGPKYFLARLRALGFRTWHNCWDESYDWLEGPARWSKIKSVMTQLAAMNHSELTQLLIQAQQICQHNRSHVLTLAQHSRELPPHVRP